MGHTGIARLCLVHRDYRTRTELAEEVREAPASIGRGGCHNSEDELVTTKKVKLTKERMAKIAAFASEPVELVFHEDIEYAEEFKYSLSSKAIKKLGKNIFGKTVKASYIVKDHAECFIDIYRDPELGLIYDSWVADTETDYQVYSTSIKKKGSKYYVTRKVYYGHWGFNEVNDNPNIQITYTIKESDKSEYGFVLTGIKLKKLDFELPDE